MLDFTQNILLVADETNLAETIRRHLKWEGFRLGWATSSSARHEITDFFANGDPLDLVIVDAGVPNADTLEFLRWTTKNYPEVSLIFVSGYGGVDMQIKTMRPAMDECAQKPITPGQMMELLGRVNQKREEAFNSFKTTPRGIETTRRRRVVKALVVDDSSLMRKIIIRMLESSPQIKVAGEAADGKQALEMIPECEPDIVILDVNMPVMDGLTTLKHIMIERPLPVIMFSAFTDEGALTTFDCLTYGAVDYICKPSKDGGSLVEKEQEIIQQVIAAARVKVNHLKKARLAKKDTTISDSSHRPIARKAILMGAGEGGCSGFLRILPYLPRHLPCAILAVQHMKDKYFDTFCDYLNRYSRIPVKKAENGEAIKGGICYFAPPGMYLRVRREASGPVCSVAPKNNCLMDRYDELLFSASDSYAQNAIGVILGGKGIDGVEGIRKIKKRAGTTLAQNPRECVVSQANTVAIDNGCADHSVPNADFPGVLWHLARSPLKP